VPGDTSQDVSLVWRQSVQFALEQSFDNCDEGVAVVIAKGREAVALKTELQKFRQGESPQTIPLPQILCRSVTIRGRLVEGFAGIAKGGIDGNDRFPRNDLKPVFIQPGHVGGWILIFSGRP
jgi:hypothetical protein